MANVVSYILQIRDQYSRTMSKYNRAMEVAAAKTEILNQKLKKSGRALSSFGASMTTRVTLPIVGGLALATRAWGKQQEAIAQVKSGLEATGGTVGRTLEQLKKQASDFQSKTIFGDEAILQGVTAQLLTFTGITKESFDGAQKAVLNVTSKLYGTKASAETLRATSIMLGKALNDPVANLGALSRSGIQFSKSQKDVIKKLFESGQKAKAQAIILKELKRQYGGAAEAISKKGLGPIIQMWNLLGDAMEQVGGAFAEFIIPHIPTLKAFLIRSIDWMKANKKLFKGIVKIGVALAVLGPALFIIGKMISIFLALKKAIVFVQSAMTALNIVMSFNPWVLAIGAVVALVILLAKNWDKVKKAIAGVWNVLKKGGAFIMEKVINPIKKMIIMVLRVLSKIPGLGKVYGAAANLLEGTDKTKETKTKAKMMTSPAQKVDVSGNITVGAEKGAKVVGAGLFNAPTGLNMAPAML